MEQRYVMRAGYEDAIGLKQGDVNIFYLEGFDNFYIGLEYAPNDNEAYTWYFYPTSEDEAFVFLYMGESTFDDLIQNLDRTNSNAVEKAWPLFASALVNGANDNYGSPALIKLGCVDKADASFWCLAQKVENIDVTEPDSLMGSYVANKVLTLLNYCGEMASQMQENEPGTIDLIAGGVKEGIRIGRVIKTAAAIGGMILGLPIFGSGEE